MQFQAYRFREVYLTIGGALVGLLLLPHLALAQATDPLLPSWNDGSGQTAIIEFVRATTERGAPRFVPPEERIATFDQDGTHVG